MSRLWFTADLHFGHEFMARLRSDRKLLWTERRNSYGMDEWMLEEWNRLVAAQDKVWFLGDFSFHGQADTKAIFAQLPGEKHLAKGNHDPKHVERLGWASVQDFKKIKWFDEDATIENVKGEVAHGLSRSLYLFHYPMLTWPNAHHGTWHLHGHSHGNLRAPESTRMDVGPDSTGKLLVSAEEVAAVLRERRYDFIDHHE